MAMQTSGETKANAGFSDYLAAERTFLAWIRTGLALMGFGFVVARFGLFLQTLQAAEPAHFVPRQGISPWFGTALILAGVIVNLLAAWQHLQTIGALNRGDVSPRSRPMLHAVAVAIFLALVGLAMAIYLVSVRTPPAASSDKETTRESTMAQPASNTGIVNLPSNHSVDETVEKLKGILEDKGVKLFALVDHSGEAERMGMTMPPTKLLIFGSPKAGTPLMLAAPSIAIDLPLKILVREDEQKKVWVSYNSAEYLLQRHGLPAELLQNIAVIAMLAAKAAG
jgi:uncharacterized protein (DUF302 family)/uncharacterized membrane protein YidH (DUF202 family)